MKIKKGLIIKEIDSEYVLIDAGLEPPVFNGIIKLNKTSKTIIELLEENEYSYDELIDKLLSIYDINKNELEKAIEPFLNELRRIRLINE